MIINFKQFINENILVPRNLEGRKEKLKQLNIRFLSQELIDGDLDLDESFMDIDPKFVKLKKVNGGVYLSGEKWTEIPEWLKDVEISGTFVCSYNKLETLKNCTQKIGRSFSCSYNQLISLEGCPKNIRGNFWCTNNKLTSLKDCTEFVGGYFSCSYNKLTSLKDCPKEIGVDLQCYNNKVKLELPEYVKLKGGFYN